MLRGGASGAEVAADATLERSPSRTLASRVRELVGGRSSPGSASSSRAASPVPQRPLQQGLEAAVLRRAATPAGMPALAEEEGPEAAPADNHPPRPLQQSLGRVARMASPVAEKRSAERAALEVQEAQLRAAVTEAEALRSRAAAAEAAAQAVLDLHAAGAAATCPAVELEGEEIGHGFCRQTIEGLFAQVGVPLTSATEQIQFAGRHVIMQSRFATGHPAQPQHAPQPCLHHAHRAPSPQVWRERLGRQRAVAEASDLRQKLSAQKAGSDLDTSGGKDSIELDEAALQALEEVGKLREGELCCTAASTARWRTRKAPSSAGRS